MKNKIKITIPEPCHESWDMMSINEKGKFCASCKKNVIDFTTSSDAVIFKTYKKNEKLCGRFTTNQLNRYLILPKEKKSAWGFIAASFITLLSLGSQQVKAQEIKTEQIDTINAAPTSDEAEIILENEITGTVKDSIYPLPAANIENLRTKLKTTTDFDGNFKLEAKKGDELIVSFIGMKPHHFIINTFTNYTINMVQDKSVTPPQVIMVGAICTVRKKSFLRRIFH